MGFSCFCGAEKVLNFDSVICLGTLSEVPKHSLMKETVYGLVQFSIVYYSFKL